jgi:protein-tyrosine phosphatase
MMNMTFNSQSGVSGILFICMGNICRSPLAEGIFQHKLSQRGVEHKYMVDSAGTGNWHAGDLADSRMRATALSHGIDLKSRARQVTKLDFKKFDMLLAMDRTNYLVLLDIDKSETYSERVYMMRAFDPDIHQELDVPDPYFGGDNGFEEVYQMLERSCENLLNILESK